MKINRAGIELIKEFEGFRPVAYLCPANVLTIGYGHTSRAGRPDVAKGMTITKQAAADILVTDLAVFEVAVFNLLKRAPTENQFSAMVSLCYNIGASAFSKSTVLRKFNEGDFAASAAAFRMWNKGGGKVLPGLIRRREAEMALFSKPSAKSEPPVLADFAPPEIPATSKGPFIMNNNLFGTVAAVVAVVMGGMTQILGCTDTVTGPVCSASWIPPQYAGYAVLAFSGLAIVAKMFRPGGVLHGLFGATAVIVAPEKSGPGTVTQADVDAPK